LKYDKTLDDSKGAGQKNRSGVYKKEKERLIALIDALDIKAEMVPLMAAECAALRKDDDSLAKLRRDEEGKWTQRAKVKHVQEGGNNMREFHLIANRKHRKKKISVRARRKDNRW
jgi:hypothetical protein